MCDMPQAFQSIQRKAAKDHKCCECREPIKKGEAYQYSSGIWDGQPSSFKQCLNCSAIMTAVADSSGLDEFPSFGDLAEWFQGYEHIGFSGQEWIDGMAEQIGVTPESLSRLLVIEEDE